MLFWMVALLLIKARAAPSWEAWMFLKFELVTSAEEVANLRAFSAIISSKAEDSIMHSSAFLHSNTLGPIYPLSLLFRNAAFAYWT